MLTVSLIWQGLVPVAQVGGLISSGYSLTMLTTAAIIRLPFGLCTRGGVNTRGSQLNSYWHRRHRRTVNCKRQEKSKSESVHRTSVRTDRPHGAYAVPGLVVRRIEPVPAKGTVKVKVQPDIMLYIVVIAY